MTREAQAALDAADSITVTSDTPSREECLCDHPDIQQCRRCSNYDLPDCPCHQGTP